MIDGLHQVAQHAEDLDRAVEFYRDVLGARLIARFDPPGIAFVELGGVRILLEGGASPATLYFHVADLAAARDDLRSRGVEFEEEPHTIFQDPEGIFGPSGEDEWLAVFRDSEGNLLGLMTRVPSDEA